MAADVTMKPVIKIRRKNAQLRVRPRGLPTRAYLCVRSNAIDRQFNHGSLIPDHARDRINDVECRNKEPNARQKIVLKWKAITRLRPPRYIECRLIAINQRFNVTRVRKPVGISRSVARGRYNLPKLRNILVSRPIVVVK